MERPVETLEGWYCEHLIWKMDWQLIRKMNQNTRASIMDAYRMINKTLNEEEPDQGSHYWFRVNGFKGDLGLMVLRPQLTDLTAVEALIAKSALGTILQPSRSFVSVTEVGTYTGKPKTDRGWVYVNAHLKPQLPTMNYICFYPMNKRRWPGANWYELSYDERQKEMHEHGTIGRRYAGKIKQYITGAIGFDDEEWGVTLFADDPIEIKKLITEMRYAAASAVYGDFPYFIIGTKITENDWPMLLSVNEEGAE